MLLGAAQLLKEVEGELPGRVKLMFQPGEESLQGAAAMVEAGVLEHPHVDGALALHVFPSPMNVGTLAWRQGPALASSDSFRIVVEGKAGHGAIPQDAVDPISIAAHIVLALQEINAREVNPQEPLVLTVCTIHGGEEACYRQGGSHHPAVVFNEGVLPLGAAVLAGCAANWLSSKSLLP